MPTHHRIKAKTAAIREYLLKKRLQRRATNTDEQSKQDFIERERAADERRREEFLQKEGIKIKPTKTADDAIKSTPATKHTITEDDGYAIDRELRALDKRSKRRERLERIDRSANRVADSIASGVRTGQKIGRKANRVAKRAELASDFTDMKIMGEQRFQSDKSDELWNQLYAMGDKTNVFSSRMSVPGGRRANRYAPIGKSILDDPLNTHTEFLGDKQKRRGDKDPLMSMFTLDSGGNKQSRKRQQGGFTFF